MSERTNELLLEIQRAALCAYLSDLLNATFDDQAKQLISLIPNDRYDLNTWNEAASYVRKKKCNCNTVDAAKMEISEHR